MNITNLAFRISLHVYGSIVNKIPKMGIDMTITIERAFGFAHDRAKRRGMDVDELASKYFARMLSIPKT